MWRCCNVAMATSCDDPRSCTSFAVGLKFMQKLSSVSSVAKVLMPTLLSLRGRKLVAQVWRGEEARLSLSLSVLWVP